MRVETMVVALLCLRGAHPLAAQGSWPPELKALRLDDFETEIAAQLREAEDDARAHPQDAARTGRLGMTLHAYEQYEPAAICYARARHLAPQELRWPYLEGLAQTALGAHEEAIAAFQAALRVQPDDPPSKLRLAEVLLAAGRFRESQVLHEALITNPATRAQAHYGLGQLQVATGRKAAGLEHYRQAVAAFPDYGRAHYALGLALRDQGLKAEAGEQLALAQQHRYQEPMLDDPLLRAVAQLNTAASDRLLQGIVLESMGKLEPSIAAHERALELNPALVQAHVNLISLFGRAGQFEKAEEHYRAAVAANPELADSHYNFGLLLLGQGRTTQAEEAFRLSLERNPFNPDSHFNYALIIERDGRLDEAAAHYRQALFGDPGHRLAHFHLGRILVYQDRLTEAASELRETLVPEDENTPRFAYALGATLARLGEKEEALRTFREAALKAKTLGQTQLVESIERDLRALEAEP